MSLRRAPSVVRAMRVVFVALLLSSHPIYAAAQLEEAAPAAGSSETPAPAGVPHSNGAPLDRVGIRALIEQETAKTGLPSNVADAVVFVESNYNSSAIGRIGEIGLMQVRPETADMLGFRGSLTELAKPEVNIHYGVTYLSQAWRLAGGDLCRALMKYRAGHGEEIMSPGSVRYCSRARDHLAAVSSPLAVLGSGSVGAPGPIKALENAGSSVNLQIATRPTRPRDVYAHFKQGTAAASRAFWAVHEARIRAINAKLESRWHLTAR